MVDFGNFINAKSFGASGSAYETWAKTVDGSNRILVDAIGDFEVGQEVLLHDGYRHHVCEVFMDRRDNSPINPRKWQHGASLDGRIELIGSSADEWVTYLIDFDPQDKEHIRWTKDYGRTWTEKVPVSNMPIEIDVDVKLKINHFPEWEWGATAAIVSSSRLVATVEKIEGNSLYLSESANVSVRTKICHSDTKAIQKAIDTAIKENKSVFLPNGRYRLTSSLYVKEPLSFNFEGESGFGTILDNSLGNVGVESPEGSCFVIENGKEFTLKNLFMLGCSSFNDREQCGKIYMKGGDSVWGFYFHKSNATCVLNTERVYIENCHARQMSAECFYAVGNKRTPPDPEPEQYNKSIIYMRCTVEDCARNAFNSAIQIENTSILHCRVRDVGGNAWEGSSRFTRIEGCYFRNTGPLGIGNSRRRNIFHEYLTTGQHVISGNHFESGCCYDRAMIRVGAAAAQVIISNNNFINFNSNVIDAFGEGNIVDLPSENTIITSNTFDMTATENESNDRFIINVSNNFVTIADNQMYVRGECDEKVIGIKISDDVTRVQIHDNTLAGLGIGIKSERVFGKVGTVINQKAFYREEPRQSVATKPMLLRRRSHGYKGWRLRWIADNTESVIDNFDGESLVFTLKDEHNIKSGDEFMIYTTVSAPWNIHDNIIDDCKIYIDLDTEVGRRAIVRNNIIDEKL